MRLGVNVGGQNENTRKETYRIVNSLLDKEFGKQLQPNGKDDEIARNLQTFFDNKVARIYESVSELSKAYDIKPQLQHEEENPSTKVPMMSSFKVMSASEVASVIQSMGSKSCCLDPIPTVQLASSKCVLVNCYL